MNANELADELENDYWDSRTNKIMLESAKMLRNQQSLIDNLNGRIERMIENQSHHEGIAHAGGFEQGHEAGRKLGMQQERALWELAASTQEIENERTRTS
jgi:hypothetical protein